MGMSQITTTYRAYIRFRARIEDVIATVLKGISITRQGEGDRQSLDVVSDVC
jgi:hypothetical protein